MTKNDSYQALLSEMYGLRQFGIKLGLDTIQKILKRIGNPQDRFQSIHVAGTNGKGSIASMLAEILRQSGFKVGLYTSPHLVRFNERICIDNSPITDAGVLSAYQEIKQACGDIQQPTFFELTTAMAFHEFKRKAVDWAVVETGMGGRLDATNALSPDLTIISNISCEHQQYLGNTIAKIAREKGGIIKPKIPLITGVTQKSAIDALNEIAAENSAPLVRLGRDFKVRKNRGTTFSYFGMDHTWRNLNIALQGAYQQKNAGLVLAACEMLIRQNVRISLQAIRAGLIGVTWPGRLEFVSRSPLILLDGAHNRFAAQKLAEYLTDRFSDRRIILVVGILNDKPYKDMLKSLLPCCTRAIITRPQIYRGLPTEILANFARQIMPDVTETNTVDSAVEQALTFATPQDVICIAGSLFVVGEARDMLDKKNLLQP